MPQSSRTRKGPKSVNKKNPMQGILERAQKTDRLRQAQIANQKKSIDRLLGEINEHDCGFTALDPQTGHPLAPRPMRGYTEEMEILHQATAVFRVENEDLTAALRQLVEAIDGTPLDGMSWPTRQGRMNLAEALAEARALITSAEPGVVQGERIPGTPYYGPALSDAQSSSEEAAG